MLYLCYRRRVLSQHPLSYRLPIQTSQICIHDPHLPPQHKQQRSHLSGHSPVPVVASSHSIKGNRQHSPENTSILLLFSYIFRTGFVMYTQFLEFLKVTHVMGRVHSDLCQKLDTQNDECISTKQACPLCDFVTLLLDKYRLYTLF